MSSSAPRPAPSPEPTTKETPEPSAAEGTRASGKRGKRRGAPDPDAPVAIEDEARPRWAGPSRSQKKRDARGVFDLGVLLTKLRPRELKRLPLDEELLEAILISHDMKRTALSRHLRRIAKLLRERDREALVLALRDEKKLP